MAAVISFPHPTTGTTGAPKLVVLEGGRSPRRRQLARTYALRRLAALVMAALALGAAIMITIGVVRAVGSSEQAVDLPATYVVEPGDTLWQIARGFDLDVDVRVVVDELAAANGGSTIRPGQRLAVPASIREL